MKVVIGSTTYTDLLNLNFSPEADVVCNSIPVNQFWCDIVTTDSITIGTVATLMDDNNQTWASYRITSADYIDAKKIRVKASLDLSVLDDTTLNSKMIGTEESLGVEAGPLFDDIFVPLAISYNFVRDGFTNTMVKGFVPKQTCRERLLWIIMAIGGYLSFSWGGGIEIRALSTSPTLIPLERTFYKPSVSYGELVTGLLITYYSYEAGEIDPLADDYVIEEEFTDGTDQGEFIDIRTPYKQVKKKLLVENPNTPVDATQNIVEIDGITVITPENVAAVSTRLASEYFRRRSVTMDIINDREYYPGQYVMGYLDKSTIVSGYIQSCSFKFGLQARAKLKLVGVQDSNVEVGGTITIRYMWTGKGTILETETILPNAYTIVYTTRYLDKTLDGHRYIFRPLVEHLTLTATSEAQTVLVNCEVALDYYEGELHILSVDSVGNYTGDDDENIVVIDQETD